MRQALFSFVVAALCVQQALSHPFDKRASDGMYNILIYYLIRLLDYFVLDTLNTDTQVLNYALTLEHLENAFYSGGLAKFDDEAFRDAGLTSEARVRFSEIAGHEVVHVATLSAVLGDQATQPCTYSLCVFYLNGVLGEILRIFALNSPYNNVHSFTALSQVFEGVGEILTFCVEVVHFN
jgi:hypothetical protein